MLAMRVHVICVALLGLGLAGVAACSTEVVQAGPGTSASSTSSSSSSGGGAKSIGDACVEGDDCDCVDGYCCNKACDGTCEACDVEGKLGQCSPVSGAPHHGACEGAAGSGVCAATCDGKKVDACTFPEVECAAGTCVAGNAKPPAFCKAGKCPSVSEAACERGCFGQTCLGVQQVAAGSSHTCAAFNDGRVFCWGEVMSSGGEGDRGQSGAATGSLTPRAVAGLTNVAGIAATGRATCALLDDKTVKCFGSNQLGELGRGGATDTNVNSVPAAVVGVSGAGFLAGGPGGGFFCAIVANGEVMCWGNNADGQLGIGSKDLRTTPTKVCAVGSAALPCAPLSGATHLALGDNHACAVIAGGEVACWGNNFAGQAGQTPGADDVLFPKLVPNVTATSLAAGNAIACAVTQTAQAMCWGGSGIAFVGNGSSDIFQPPASVCGAPGCPKLLEGVTALSSADESVCAVANGTVTCWGGNTGGQLGDGTTPDRTLFAATTAVASGAVAVASGETTNFAIISADGVNRDLRCWGNNSQGQCGDDTSTGVRATPVSPAWPDL